MIGLGHLHLLNVWPVRTRFGAAILLILSMILCSGSIKARERIHNHSEVGNTIKEATFDVSVLGKKDKIIFQKEVKLIRSKNSLFEIPGTDCRISLEISRIYFLCVKTEDIDQVMATVDFNGHAEYLHHGKKVFILVKQVITYE